MTIRTTIIIGLFSASAALCIAWIGPATWASAPRQTTSTGPLRPNQSERALPVGVIALRSQVADLAQVIKAHRPFSPSLLLEMASDWNARLDRAEDWVSRRARESSSSPSREELTWRGLRIFRDRSQPLRERVLGLKSVLSATAMAPLDEQVYAEIRDLIQGSGDPDLERHAPFLIEALGMDPYDRSRDLLKDLGLHAPSHRVREAAVRGLSVDATNPATRGTLEWIRDFDPSPRTRKAAARVLKEAEEAKPKTQ